MSGDLGLFAADPELAADIDRDRRQALDAKWRAERHTKPPRCRSGRCRAPIGWLLTPDGKWMPVDSRPGPAGTVEVERQEHAQTARVVPATATIADAIAHGRGAPPPARYTPHFQTCPDASQFRRAR